MANTFLLFSSIIIAFIFVKVILEYALSKKPKSKNSSSQPSVSPTPGTFAKLNSSLQLQSLEQQRQSVYSDMSPYISKDRDLPYIYRNYRGGRSIGV